MTPENTARVLVQALPYIRRFAGKAVVVKLGGAAIDKELDRALAQDVLLLRSVGVRCVLVHGGGPQVDALMRRVVDEVLAFQDFRPRDDATLLLAGWRLPPARRGTARPGRRRRPPRRAGRGGPVRWLRAGPP